MVFRAQGTVIQVLGRLRYIEGTETQFVDTFDRGISAQVRHYQVRKEVYKQKCSHYSEYNLL